MSERVNRAVAVVGIGAVLPDAPNASTFWTNVRNGRYSISDVPEGRWDPSLYFDADAKAPDKTYSKIGGWATQWDWDPLKWRLPIPPKVSDSMDRTHIWSIVAAREALLDYGYPDKELDGDRTAVVLGNAMGGDRHYQTAMRIYLPEYVRELRGAPSFSALDPAVQAAVLEEFKGRLGDVLPEITEDTMPGELANITAGRIANLFNFHGPNFVTDAACASALAGMDAAIEGLEQGNYDTVLTGGVDANMSASTFVKFCKIGALSATGTRPYGAGADGFVMGEGAAVFLLKRLEDAEKSGDHIYAVVRGLAGSSDGRGKGITAPNPVGQKFAVKRAWENAGTKPDAASLMEGHGTSTRVGDVVEVESLSEVFSSLGMSRGSLPLGSVKSNIGHLKAAAGAAGMLKAVMALNDKVLPPSLNAEATNPNIDFKDSPLFVNTELQEWKASPGQVRQAGVSAFGFGGTNFHVVLEEYIPGRIRTSDNKVTYSLVGPDTGGRSDADLKPPIRGALVVGGTSDEDVVARLRVTAEAANAGTVPAIDVPMEEDLRSDVRVAIDYADATDLASKADRAIAALEGKNDAAWQLLANQGVFHGTGTAGQVAFLYTGQGSQYVNMLDTLRHTEPIVANTFAEADAVMTPILSKPLTDYIFIDSDDPEAVTASEFDLMQTEITQPAVLAVDIALTRLMAAYGVEPNMVMGHSLGEYGALVAAGSLPFDEALMAVAGRGREMASVVVEDRGLMAAVFAPLEEIEAVVESVDGYVVIANVNSHHQAVIGGATPAVETAMEQLVEAGHQVIQLPVSHAFHTEIVAPASGPLKAVLARLDLRSPSIPVIANITGDFYPRGPQVETEMIEILGKQIASPVQFVKGLERLYRAGARVFVEMGPKKALHGLTEDVLGDRGDVRSLFTNHPKQGDAVSFNQALCGLYAAGIGTGRAAEPSAVSHQPTESATDNRREPPAVSHRPSAPEVAGSPDTYGQLGHLLADFLDSAYEVYQGRPAPALPQSPAPRNGPIAPVVVTGAGIGLPGMARVFDESALSRLLHGEQFIDAVPIKNRQDIVDHHITRLVKSKEGGGRFETIDSQSDVIKLAGRGGTVDLAEEFGFPEDRIVALERTSELAIGAGIDALTDAGIPLVMRYKTATTGAMIQERWMLPEAMRDTTAVIFASAFPGASAFIDEATRFAEDKAKHERLSELRELRSRVQDPVLGEDLDRRIRELGAELSADGYAFDRRYLYRALSFAHAQFAEYIGARGPNTQVNAACASTTQAVAIAEDWINARRCDRVIIISADDVTSDTMLGWIGSGFLAVGAAATDEVVEEAAVPFDRRRHGMILGMGAAALVVESVASASERGIQPLAEVLAAETANSAFHGSRLDPAHIKQVMEKLVATAESRWGISRNEIAPEMMFVSHETYTPARGGSAQAEIDALRFVFADTADSIVITNTKGYTGHAMATGVEDVLAIKAMETGVVPRVPNFKEVDPDLGNLNLSQGGTYPVRYGLRLGAGFGSQVSMTLYRAIPSPLGRHPDIDQLGFEYRVVDADRWTSWLREVTGYDSPEIEVVKRTLRVADHGSPQRQPAQPATVEPPLRWTDPSYQPSAESAGDGYQAPEPVGTVVSSEVAAGSDPVAVKVLEIVAAETGYPADMLALDLDLEADLGIDTVKQAEMFAAIREEWGIERDDSVALRDYPTLEHVIGFVYDGTDIDRPSAESAGDGYQAPEPPLTPVSDEAADVSIPRRIPVPVLRPDLGWCSSTGVTIGESSRVVVFADEGGVGASLIDRLEKRGVDILALDRSLDAESLAAALDAWGTADVTGVYWLPGLDADKPINDLDLDAWREALRVRVKLLYATMRHLYDAVGGPGSFLVSATRLGGQHGYGSVAPTAPMGGAVTGFTKTYKREKPEALVKAIDFPASRKTAALAEMLVEETLLDPGAVEIGRTEDGRRWSVGLAAIDLPVEPSGLVLTSESVFVVTGAAGSIVSAITADLAGASGGTFHLLDLVPEPDASDPNIDLFRTNRDELQRVIFASLAETGKRATPAMVEREIAAIERSSAALEAIEAIEAGGGTALYHSVNLLDGEAMSDVMTRIAEAHDRVDVVLHAGGLEISRLLPDKQPNEFDLVFDVKADGWFSLLKGLESIDLGAVVSFSSIAGRFGNGGQADYSAANDLLCKSSLAFASTRPGTTAIAIDWTAWGDIGMATRGSIPTVMKAAGIDMLPASIGTPLVRQEIVGATGSREVLVAGRLGMLMEEFDATGGIHAESMDVSTDSVMVGEVAAFGLHTGLTVSTTLDPKEQGFLFDHQIDGTPVLPGVMGIEAFAEIANLPFEDLVVQAIEDVDFVAPFKFYRNEPRTLTVSAVFASDGDDVIARCRLIGVRELATSDEPQVTTHFTGTVRLSSERLPVEAVVAPDAASGEVRSDDVYRVYFHGPTYQVLASAWTDGDLVGGTLAADIPPNHVPEHKLTLTGPRLVELCFQTAGMWQIGTTGMMALPMHIDRVIIGVERPSDRRAGVTAIVRPVDGSFDAVVVDGSGKALVAIEGYRTIQLPGALSDDEVAPLREAMTPDA